MTDLEVLQKFSKQVSWFDKCEVIELDFYAFLKTEHYLMRPLHFSKYRLGEVILTKAFADKYKSPAPHLLIWGNPSDQEAERIWYDIHTNPTSSKCYVTFLDVEASVHISGLIVKAMDGINKQKTFENWMKGDSEVVYEWDN